MSGLVMFNVLDVSPPPKNEHLLQDTPLSLFAAVLRDGLASESARYIGLTNTADLSVVDCHQFRQFRPIEAGTGQRFNGTGAICSGGEIWEGNPDPAVTMIDFDVAVWAQGRTLRPPVYIRQRSEGLAEFSLSGPAGHGLCYRRDHRVMNVTCESPDSIFKSIVISRLMDCWVTLTLERLEKWAEVGGPTPS